MVLNQPPFINIGDRNSGQYLTFLGYKPGEGNQYIKHKADIKISNDKLEKYFEKYSNITFLDVYSYFINQNNNSNSLVIKDSDVLYYDDDHLSYQGTSLLKNELDNIIIEIISDKKRTNK